MLIELRQKTQILSPISGSSVILVNFIIYLLISLFHCVLNLVLYCVFIMPLNSIKVLNTAHAKC